MCMSEAALGVSEHGLGESPHSWAPDNWLERISEGLPWVPLVQAVHLHESHGPRVIWVKWYSPAGCKINSNCHALGYRASLSTIGIIVEFSIILLVGLSWECFEGFYYSGACLS